MRLNICFAVRSLTVALVCALGSGPLVTDGQTVSLPTPPSSQLDRVMPVQYLAPPPTQWDPYSPQGTQLPAAAPQAGNWAPSALTGQPGYPGYSTAAPSLVPPQAPPYGAPPGGSPASSFSPQAIMASPTVQQTMRVFQGVRGSWAYLYGSGDGTSVGVNELDTTATFAIPFFHDSQANLNHAPLLITPGFGLQLWDGPQTTQTMLADLPPSTYDVFVDAAWNPQFTPLFGAELGVRTGIYTNWDVMVSQSWRIMGRAVGTLQLTPTMQGKAGIVYLDRNQVKLLPVVGMTWVPNANARYDILFPTPKAAWRFSEVANRALWGYVAGEYGGGAWTFRRSTGQISPFDYNDIRIVLGGELVPKTPQGLTGHFEVGYVFYRQLFFVDGPPQIQDLDDTWMLRLGLGY